MSSSPDNHSSNINIKQSEERLNHELKSITPVIGNIIKFLFNSFNGIENNTLPSASQLLSAFPQLHSVLQNTNKKSKIHNQHMIDEILSHPDNNFIRKYSG